MYVHEAAFYKITVNHILTYPGFHAIWKCMQLCYPSSHLGREIQTFGNRTLNFILRNQMVAKVETETILNAFSKEKSMFALDSITFLP